MSSLVIGGTRPPQVIPPQEWLFCDWMGYRASQWYGPQISASIGTSAVVGGAGGAANSPMYSTPIFIFAPVSIDQLGIGVGAAVVGALGKLALYAHDSATVAPSTLIEECVGTVDMNAVLGTWNTLPLAAPRVLQRGWYHIISVFNAAAQPFTAQGGAAGYGGLAPLFGQANGIGLARNSAASQTTRIQSANVDFSAALPASFPTPTFGTTIPGMPICGFRVTP